MWIVGTARGHSGSARGLMLTWLMQPRPTAASISPEPKILAPSRAKHNYGVWDSQMETSPLLGTSHRLSVPNLTKMSVISCCAVTRQPRESTMWRLRNPQASRQIRSQNSALIPTHPGLRFMGSPSREILYALFCSLLSQKL